MPAAVTAATAAVPPLDADSTLAFVDPPARRLAKRAVALTGLAVYLAYLAYRGLYTLNAEAPIFSGLVYFAEIHGFLSLFFYYHQGWALRRRDVPAPPPGLKVDVFITTYNEDVDLLRQTVRGALAMRYPHRTFVLDDGRREARDLLALRLPAASLAASPLALTGTAEAALARPTLTRRHLETIAEATHRAGQVDLEVRALARLAALEPGDPAIAVRYGDALRRAGRLDEAERIFRRVLEGSRPAEAAR